MKVFLSQLANVQQTLSLEDEIDFSIPTIDEPIAEVVPSLVNDLIEPVVESHNYTRKNCF